MTIEGAVGIAASVAAGSVALLGFGLDSAIEGLASAIVIWRFTGGRRLSHEAEQTNDAATRQRLYFKIQEIWARDQWFFALYYPPFVNAVSSHVQSFHESPLGYFIIQGVHKT